MYWRDADQEVVWVWMLEGYERCLASSRRVSGRLTEVLVLYGGVLSVIWVKECIDDEVGNATLLEGVACILDH